MQIFRILLRHQWLEISRSVLWSRKLVVNILVGILFIYLGANFLALGWVLDVLLQNLFPDENPIKLVNGFLLYYLFIDLALRFFLQDFPVLSVSVYRLLPIKNSSLINYLIVKSLGSFFNLIPLFLFLPFYVKQVAGNYGSNSIIWLIAVLLLTLVNHYSSYYLKSIFNVKPGQGVFIIVVLGVLGYLEYMGLTALYQYFGDLVESVVNWPAALVIPFFLLFLIIQFDRNLLKNQLYIVDTNNRSKPGSITLPLFQSLRFSGTNSTIKNLLILELKLILNNKRPKIMAILSVAMIFYGLFFFFSMDIEGQYFPQIMGSLFMMSGFALNYGQLLFSWDSSFYEHYLTNDLSFGDLLKAKYHLLVNATLLCWVVCVPFVFLDTQILYLNTMMALLTIGIIVPLMLFIGVMNKKRIDLMKGAFFNYEGTSGMHFLIIIPVMVLPFLLFYPLHLTLGSPFGTIAIGVGGLIGILFRNSIIAGFANKMLIRKYKTLRGFKEE